MNSFMHISYLQICFWVASLTKAFLFCCKLPPNSCDVISSFDKYNSQLFQQMAAELIESFRGVSTYVCLLQLLFWSNMLGLPYLALSVPLICQTLEWYYFYCGMVGKRQLHVRQQTGSCFTSEVFFLQQGFATSLIKIKR